MNLEGGYNPQHQLHILHSSNGWMQYEHQPSVIAQLTKTPNAIITMDNWSGYLKSDFVNELLDNNVIPIHIASKTSGVCNVLDANWNRELKREISKERGRMKLLHPNEVKTKSGNIKAFPVWYQLKILTNVLSKMRESRRILSVSEMYFRYIGFAFRPGACTAIYKHKQQHNENQNENKTEDEDEDEDEENGVGIGIGIGIGVGVGVGVGSSAGGGDDDCDRKWMHHLVKDIYHCDTFPASKNISDCPISDLIRKRRKPGPKTDNIGRSKRKRAYSVAEVTKLMQATQCFKQNFTDNQSFVFVYLDCFCYSTAQIQIQRQKHTQIQRTKTNTKTNTYNHKYKPQLH